MVLDTQRLGQRLETWLPWMMAAMFLVELAHLVALAFANVVLRNIPDDGGWSWRDLDQCTLDGPGHRFLWLLVLPGWFLLSAHPITAGLPLSFALHMALQQAKHNVDEAFRTLNLADEATKAVMKHVTNSWAWAQYTRQAHVVTYWCGVACLSMPLMMVDGQRQLSAGRWVFAASTVVATMQSLALGKMQHPLHRARGSVVGYAPHLEEAHTITHQLRHREVMTLVDLSAAWELLWIPGLSSHYYASVQAFLFLSIFWSVAVPHLAYKGESLAWSKVFGFLFDDVPMLALRCVALARVPHSVSAVFLAKNTGTRVLRHQAFTCSVT